MWRIRCSETTTTLIVGVFLTRQCGPPATFGLSRGAINRPAQPLILIWDRRAGRAGRRLGRPSFVSREFLRGRRPPPRARLGESVLVVRPESRHSRPVATFQSSSCSCPAAALAASGGGPAGGVPGRDKAGAASGREPAAGAGQNAKCKLFSKAWPATGRPAPPTRPLARPPNLPSRHRRRCQLIPLPAIDCRPDRAI
jgi:hypothetical protein